VWIFCVGRDHWARRKSDFTLVLYGARRGSRALQVVNVIFAHLLHKRAALFLLHINPQKIFDKSKKILYNDFINYPDIKIIMKEEKYHV